MPSNHRSRELLDTLLTKAANPVQVEALLRVLGFLENKDIPSVLNYFVAVAKVIKVRQDGSSRALRAKEVRSALDIISFHYQMTQEVHISRDGLDALIGRGFTEGQALDYYEKNVEGRVTDRGGREIILGTEGSQHLYKDPASGKHTVKPENFQTTRAKRLPWIHWTLKNSLEVYVQTVERPGGQSWRVFGYVQTFLVPYRDKDTGVDKVRRNYLFVVARRERKDAAIEFVTAYYFEDHETLLKKVAAFEPFYLIAPKPA